MRLDKVIKPGSLVSSTAGAAIGRVRTIYIDENNEPFLVLEDRDNSGLWLFQGMPVPAINFKVSETI